MLIKLKIKTISDHWDSLYRGVYNGLDENYRDHPELENNVMFMALAGKLNFYVIANANGDEIGLITVADRFDEFTKEKIKLIFSFFVTEGFSRSYWNQVLETITRNAIDSKASGIAAYTNNLNLIKLSIKLLGEDVVRAYLYLPIKEK